MELKIIDLYADWCAPCKTLSPILEEVGKELDIVIDKINIDDNDAVVDNYQIRSIPTLIFIKGGVEIGRHSGMIQKDRLIDKIKTLNI